MDQPHDSSLASSSLQRDRPEFQAAGAAKTFSLPGHGSTGIVGVPRGVNHRVAALLGAHLAYALDPPVASGPAPPAQTALPIVLRSDGVRVVGATARAHTTGPGVIRSPDAATATTFEAAMARLPVVLFVPHQPALRAAAPFPAVLEVPRSAAPLAQATGPAMVD